MATRRSVYAAVVVLCASFTLMMAWAQTALAVEAPVVEDESVLDVSATSATVQATINPKGSVTSYRFEYGTSNSYGATAPQTEGEIAAGTQGEDVSVHIQSLDPATTYHYRVVATGPGGSANGSDLTFTTQATGGELVLPDNRQWELVSPPNKHGALIEPGREEGGAIQAASAGSAIAYYASAPVTGEEVGSRSPEPSQILSQRGANGWTTKDLAPPNNEANQVAVGFGTDYRAFSSDLSLGLLEPLQNLPLSSEATEWTPYLREDETEDYRPLVTASNVLPGTKFGRYGSRYGNARFEAGSPDLRHLVISSAVPLTEGAVEGGLYEWSGGSLQLISVLPGSEKTPASGYPFGLYVGDRTRDVHAVSDNGSRVVFSGNSHLYLRDTSLGQTVQLDVGGGSGNPKFGAANAEGSKIFFTDGAELTPGAQPASLYQCEIEVTGGKLECALTDLSPAGQVTGVIGASEDGSYVYFAANREEFYLAHDGTTSLVAVSGPLPGSYFGDPEQLTARVSPNGRYLAFLSTLSLTGYDNRDVVSGERDTEVYLYDADSAQLTCASCDPTGARPTGLDLSSGGTTPDGNTPMVNRSGTFTGGQASWWLAGSVPGWTNIGTGGQDLYQSRYLSESGELFFDSTEALVPQDVNGLEDVYEYEPDGVSGCVRDGGCVSLVSSGESQEESVFMDASESGDDVFFVTGQPLVDRDYDHALDVYDARVCSAQAPCASEPVAPPPCDSGDSCKAAPSPQPEIFGAPASATFNGQGNVVTIGATSTKKVTPKQKLESALKVCERKHRHNRHKRQLCQRRIRGAQTRLGARGATVRHRNVKASGRGSGR